MNRSQASAPAVKPVSAKVAAFDIKNPVLGPEVKNMMPLARMELAEKLRDDVKDLEDSVSDIEWALGMFDGLPSHN